VEANALYDLLESDIVPMFYERGADDLPRRWAAAMKSSIGALSFSFNTQRMLKDYTVDFYTKAHQRCRQLMACGSQRARSLAGWLVRVEAAWPQVAVETVDAVGDRDISVGSRISVRASVRLGGLAPEDVAVELYLGRLKADAEIADAAAILMQPTGQDSPAGVWFFEARDVECRRSGRLGYTVRIRPFHPEEARRFLPGLIRWAGEETAASSAA
jgi:glycogen phosphorylase